MNESTLLGCHSRENGNLETKNRYSLDSCLRRNDEPEGEQTDFWKLENPLKVLGKYPYFFLNGLNLDSNGVI